MTWKTDEATTDEGWEFEATFGIAQMRLPQREAAAGARTLVPFATHVVQHVQGRLGHLRRTSALDGHHLQMPDESVSGGLSMSTTTRCASMGSWLGDGRMGC